MQILRAFRYNPLRMAAQDKARQLPGRGIASALNLYIGQELFRASCPEASLSKTRLRVRLLGHGNSAALTMRPQLWNNCVMCHQVFLRSAAKKHVSITAGCRPHGLSGPQGAA
jgi:hypothetical protein